MAMQKRVLNFRPTVPDFNQTDYVAGNYYPVNSAISISDNNWSGHMTVHNDRPQGGSSLYNGEIELMQNRRLFFDDWKGVNEPLNETNQFGRGI
jgi:lysosomal alpha-mannosidase